MAVKGIAFTMYPVTDVARAVAFYHDGLGLMKAGLDGAAWVEFEVAGGTFGVGSFEQGGKPGSAQSLALEVGDLVAFCAALAQRGIEATAPYELANCRISVVRDPDGNQVWLHESKETQS